MTTMSRRERIEQLRRTIDHGLDDLRDERNWTAYLDFTAGFHKYSLNNIMLMLVQSEGTATLVAGYQQWKRKGRIVRRGEHGMRILAHGTRIIRDGDGNPILDDDGQPLRRQTFPIVTVFDVSQTDPIDPGQDVYGRYNPRPATGDDGGVYDKCAAWLEKQGWRVERAHLPGRVNGATSITGSNVITVDDTLVDRQAARTLLHESAHMLLHSTLTAEEYEKNRGLYETEAESVAYVTARWAGLDVAKYSIPYVAGWSRLDRKVLKKAAENVRRAADTLITGLDLKEATL